MGDLGLRSGEVAAAAGVDVETLRYYERRGLLQEPRRTLGGHRAYSLEAVTVLRAIKGAQRLGFSLAEIGELLDAGRPRHAAGPGGALPERARAKLVEVEARMADLAVVRDALRTALAAGCTDVTACAEDVRCPLPFGELAHPASGDS